MKMIKMITIGMMMIKACPNQIYQEKEDEVDLMFADIEPEDEWQDKVRCCTKFDADYPKDFCWCYINM